MTVRHTYTQIGCPSAQAHLHTHRHTHICGMANERATRFAHKAARDLGDAQALCVPEASHGGRLMMLISVARARRAPMLAHARTLLRAAVESEAEAEAAAATAAAVAAQPKGEQIFAHRSFLFYNPKRKRRLRPTNVAARRWTTRGRGHQCIMCVGDSIVAAASAAKFTTTATHTLTHARTQAKAVCSRASTPPQPLPPPLTTMMRVCLPRPRGQKPTGAAQKT